MRSTSKHEQIAKDAVELLGETEAALRARIEVIAGREEARLHLCGRHARGPGASGSLSTSGGLDRIRHRPALQPIVMESIYIGCVNHSRTFFSAANVDEFMMRQAQSTSRLYSYETRTCMDAYELFEGGLSFRVMIARFCCKK